MLIAEAMAAVTPMASSANASLPLPAAALPPLEAVRLHNANPTRHPQPVELPDPPSPTMLSEAAACSRSKATPAAVGPAGHNKATGPVLSKPHKTAGWPWRRSLSRPPSADGSRPTPSAASMTAAIPIALQPSQHAHGQSPAAVAAHAPGSAASSRSLGDQLTEALHSSTAAAKAGDTANPRQMYPTGSAVTQPDEGTAASGTEALASAALDDAEQEPLNAETGLTLSQHQQLLDEGHFGGWSSASGVIKREKAQRTRSIDPAALLPRLGSRQNSHDLGIIGSSPERRSFFGIRHTHASPVGSSPRAGVSRQGSGQSLPSHSPMKPSNVSMSPPTHPLVPPPSHPPQQPDFSYDHAQRFAESMTFNREQSSDRAFSKGFNSIDGSSAQGGPSACVSGGSTLAPCEQGAQPAGPSPFSMPAMQGAAQQGSFMPFDTDTEAADGFTGGVYGIAIPPQTRAGTSGLARGIQSSTDRLAASEDGSDQLQTSARTPSGSSSGEGTHNSRSSFTQSVAKLGREALENLQDLQTAAQRALKGELLNLHAHFAC